MGHHVGHIIAKEPIKQRFTAVLKPHEVLVSFQFRFAESQDMLGPCNLVL